MPNWCNNEITLTHADPVMIHRAAKAMSEGAFLREFIPMPPELEGTTSPGDTPNWYTFCTNEWGTKWDVTCTDVEIPDVNTVTGSFDSAWSPPIAAYEKLTEMGFTISASYYEPGMGFVGRWDCGTNECYYTEYETSETVRELIGAELDDCYSISEYMVEYEEEERCNIDFNSDATEPIQQEKPQ